MICDTHTHALNCLYNTCCLGKQRFLKIKNKTLFLGAKAIVLYFMHFKALAPFNMYFFYFLYIFFIAHSNSLQPCTIKEYQIAFLCAFFPFLSYGSDDLSSLLPFFFLIFFEFFFTLFQHYNSMDFLKGNR